MAKKSAAAEAKPTTVAERRQAIRAEKGEPASGPGLKKVVIDLSKPNAREKLTALYPRPTSETYIDATPETEAAALLYIEQRDVESASKSKKTVAGNVLCNAIAKDKGIKGNGWKATWGNSAGNIDWAKVCEDFKIPEATLERPQTVTDAIADSVAYLASDAAARSLDADTYWPKWHSPWWHKIGRAHV